METKRWYEREPVVVFVPLSVLAAAALQTVAFLGYKLFYNSFGVRPEEVGYDYVALFPRTAIPLAFLLAFGLAVIALVSLVFAFYGGVIAGLVSAVRNENKRSPDEAARKDGLLFAGIGVTFAAVLVASWLGIPNAVLYLVLAVVGLIVLVEYLIARDAGSRSWLHVLFAPRIYRAPRRIVLIGFALALPLLDPTFDPSLGSVVTVTALIFIFDRFLPVVSKDSDARVEGGGRSPWLRRTVTLALAGGLGVLVLTSFTLALPWLGLSEQVRDVRAGRPLVVDYGNPGLIAALLAEPRADRVTVRWVGNNPPVEFGPDATRRITGIPLTYFGSSNGISVFYDPSARAGGGTGTVYRWPTAAVAIDAVDTGAEPS